MPLRAGTAAARAWLTKSPARGGYAVVGSLLLLSWPFGGWAPAEDEAPEATEPGTEVAAAPFTVTVERAVAGPDLGPPFRALDDGVDPAQADDQHVLLFLTVRNDSDRTLPARELTTGLLEISGLDEPVTVTGSPQADVTLWSEVYTDHEQPQTLVGLGPGLEHRVVLHQPASGPAPEALTVEIHARTYRQSTLDDTMLWADPTPVTTVTVPVETASSPLYGTGDGR